MKWEFEPSARKQLDYWLKKDTRVARKIYELLEEIEQTPFSGIGKPEPLKHQYTGCWSRRIDKKNRLVYRVEESSVVILSCRFHYDN